MNHIYALKYAEINCIGEINPVNGTFNKGKHRIWYTAGQIPQYGVCDEFALKTEIKQLKEKGRFRKTFFEGDGVSLQTYVVNDNGRLLIW